MKPLKKSPRDEAAAAAAYLAALPTLARSGLMKLRKMIGRIIPEAKLGMSYGIPAFRLNGRPLVWFAAFKEHSSFFPGAGAIRVHAAALKRYKISKGTIQFPHGEPPPARLVVKLIAARRAELRKK